MESKLRGESLLELYDSLTTLTIVAHVVSFIALLTFHNKLLGS